MQPTILCNERPLRVSGARVFHDGAFHEETLFVLRGRFVSQAEFLRDADPAAVDELHADGLLLLPGLTDLHMHGAVNADLCDGTTDAIAAILRFEARQGVTQIVSTSLTVSSEQLEAVFSAFGTLYRQGGTDEGAMLAGLHMEGPYISPDKCGAQNPAYICGASMAQFEHLNKLAGGGVKILSLAPEREGALDFIAQMKEKYPGVRISVAHTTADYETAAAAFAAGASHVTHLFNAMPPLHHRNPGVIAAASDCPHVAAEVISDGIHLHPAMIRAAFRLFPGRIALISDSMRACGLKDGDYDLGGQKVIVTGWRAILENGALAGSVTNLYDCLRFAVSQGIPLETAVTAASEYPASLIGIDGEAGCIREGRRANFILADPKLERRAVYLNGRRLA